MNLTVIFGVLGGLLVLAFAANRLFDRTRVPDVIVLMAAGVLLGPVMGWVKSGEFSSIADGFGTLALMLILFQGGLELDVRDTLRHFPGGLMFSLFAYTFSVALVIVVMSWGQGYSFRDTLLIAAVLGCTSSSITLPILQQIEVSTPAKLTLLLESSLSDTFGIVTVGGLLKFAPTGTQVAGALLRSIVFELAMAVLFAVVAAAIWSYLLPKLSEKRFWQVLTFALVLLLYAASQSVAGNGLIAVLFFGLALANMHRIDRRVLSSAFGISPLLGEHHSQVLAFQSELAFLVRSFFFVLIGAMVSLKNMEGRWFPFAVIIAALFFARWLAVTATSWTWRDFNPRERELTVWIMPRGLITVVLALQVLHAAGSEFAFLPELAFAVILTTNAFLVIGTIRARRIATMISASGPVPPANEMKPEN